MGDTPSTAFAPAGAAERLVHIDVIRGMALLGVLVMNLQYHFRGPFAAYVLDRHPWPGLLNGIVDDALRLLVEGKAMGLFCMLFAVGLAIQMERNEARGGAGFWPFAWRRMLALMAIGLLHVALVWEGDILFTYALAGILLFPFLRRKPKTVLVWIGVLAGITVALVIVFTVRRMLGGGGGGEAGRSRAYAAMADWITRAMAVYGHGTWWEATLFRLQEWRAHVLEQFPALTSTFFSSLVGLAVWRTGVLKAPGEHLPALRRWAPWLVGLGLVGGVVDLYLKPLRAFCLAHRPWGGLLLIPASTAAEFGATLLALGYAAVLILAWQRARWQVLLKPFSYAGKMALTNYLVQSVVMTALFHGWGLGLYGRVSPAQGVAVSLIFFAAQVLVCRWWLGRFAFGPAEWAWRCASYARRQPFLLTRGA